MPQIEHCLKPPPSEGNPEPAAPTFLHRTRHNLTIVTAFASLALSLTCVVIALRSYFIEDVFSCSWCKVHGTVAVSHHTSVDLMAGRMTIWWYRISATYPADLLASIPQETSTYHSTARMGEVQRGGCLDYLPQWWLGSFWESIGFRYHSEAYTSTTSAQRISDLQHKDPPFEITEDRASRTVGLPTWLPALIFAALPFQQMIARRRRKRVAIGLCPTCRYDLRVHHAGIAGDKCPECGTAIHK